LKAIKIFKTLLGENHPDYAGSVLSLAKVYENTGRYHKAEELYLKAINIFKNHFGTNHPDYAASLKDLVSLYEKMGEYGKAEMYYQPLMYKYLYHVQKDGFTEKVYYAALILTTDELKFVILDNGKELEKNTSIIIKILLGLNYKIKTAMSNTGQKLLKY